MGFLSDYIEYNSGNECPENYHIWASLALISSVVGPKVVLKQDYFDVFCNLYILLVGEQGGRKTVAKDIAFEVLREMFPKILTSASCESHQSICQEMELDDNMQIFIDPTGEVFNTTKGATVEFRQLSMFITEFRNYLSINPAGMISFLVDIYDRTKTYYNYKTKNRSSNILIHPYIVLLACETPDNLISDMKMNIVTGGFFRRVILVFETDNDKRIPRPSLSPSAREAMIRVRDFLLAVSKVVGQFKWDPEAVEWYDKWYMELKLPSDPFLRGFYRSKHIQMLKVGMLLSLMDSFELILKKDHLMMALALVDRIEKNLSLISAGIGRNALVQPTAKLLRYLEQNNGVLQEKRLQSMMFCDMSPEEYRSVLEHLIKTDQVFLAEQRLEGGLTRRIVCASSKRQEIIDQAKARIADKQLEGEAGAQSGQELGSSSASDSPPLAGR